VPARRFAELQTFEPLRRLPTRSKCAATSTMSTHIPLRMARIPAQGLRRQCLFPRPRSSPAPRHFAASTARPFSATTARLRDPPSGYRLEDTALQDAAARNVVGPAPSVTMGKMMKEIDSMAEDIGLLQNTIIRAPLGQLPPVYNRQFWGYMWTLLKSRAASLWTRSLFRQCLQKTKMSRYLPVDMGKNKKLELHAKKLYESVHKAFVAFVVLPSYFGYPANSSVVASPPACASNAFRLWPSTSLTVWPPPSPSR
jgi:protein MBA1